MAGRVTANSDCDIRGNIVLGKGLKLRISHCVTSRVDCVLRCQRNSMAVNTMCRGMYPGLMMAGFDAGGTVTVVGMFYCGDGCMATIIRRW